MDDLRCITLHQPYPSLIAHGVKRWETRTWKTSYRGPLAIHASKRLYTAADKHADPDLFFAAHDVLELERSGGVYGLPYGEVVTVAQLTDCIPILGHGDVPDTPGRYIEDHHVHYAPDARSLWLCKLRSDGAIDTLDRIEDQRPYGYWAPGGWAWQLENVRPLAEPIPAKGKERLWRPDAELAAAIAKEAKAGG